MLLRSFAAASYRSFPGLPLTTISRRNPFGGPPARFRVISRPIPLKKLAPFSVSCRNRTLPLPVEIIADDHDASATRHFRIRLPETFLEIRESLRVDKEKPVDYEDPWYGIEETVRRSVQC